MMGTAARTAILVAILVPLELAGQDAFPGKELVAASIRHHLPMPPTNAQLVLAHMGGWYPLGDKSTSRDPAMYSPAFLLAAESTNRITVLRGTESETLGTQGDNQPLWRPFSTNATKPRLGGYVSDFGRLSAFVCAVQLAARGDERNAQRLWRRVDSADYFSDLEYRGPAHNELKDSQFLLAQCIYKHLRERLLTQPQNWPEIYSHLEALVADYPTLKTRSDAPAMLRGLQAALQEKPALPDSTEALLVASSRIPFNRKGPPYWCRNRSEDSPANRIILRGADAVPDLITLLADQRITTQEMPAIMNLDSRILTLGELSQQLLTEITGLQRQPELGPLTADDFRRWFKETQAHGEKATLIASAFERKDGVITEVQAGPVSIIARKYPEALPALCEEFSREAKPSTQPFALAEAVRASGLAKERKVEVLVDFAARGSLEHKRAVLQQLALLDPKKCSQLLAPLIQSLPSNCTGPCWLCPQAALTHVVMLLEDDEIWSAYLRAAKRSSVGLRMEMMNPMNYSYIGSTNRLRRLAFLAAFLGDRDVRQLPKNEANSEFAGPCAAFTIQRIVVGDFAAAHIASILNLPDDPDEFWTAAQWKALHQKVKQGLAAESLPEF